MQAAREIFERNQSEIINRLEFSFNFIQAEKYSLLEFLTENEADLYLAGLYVRSFFFMQSNQHLVTKKEIIL